MPRLMGERELLHRIGCIAFLAELLHLGNRAWARWRFSESIIATARAPAKARMILPLSQGARVERDVHRGADTDRRAILELHGHRRAILVVTDGRANLLQVVSLITFSAPSRLSERDPIPSIRRNCAAEARL